MEINVEKCGIIVDPIAFVIVYRTPDKLRRKVFPLRDFTSTTDVELTARHLKTYDNLEKVPLIKIKKMLRLIQELLLGREMSEAVDKINKQFELKLNDNLNKLPTDELELQKELMESIFLKNQIKRGDEDFVYDKRMDFTGKKMESDWDLEGDDNFWN
ncbi:hypothetical protein RUM44_005174 [Polyplax serrata]|uniref:Centrosomal protein of 19 kDa n=1 Tax=Polyplax serrata TaxID=468196 RepID=A0ABR1AEB4_POLSC